MASQKTKRRSRKRRQRSESAPRAVVSQRRLQRSERAAEQRAQAERVRRRGNRQLGTEGERPPGLFGQVPVSEIAIFVGIVGTIVGFATRNGVALIVGLVVCALGVFEVTAREHFTGFRSHASLLAAFPAVVAGALVAVLGQPHQRSVLLVVVVPVWALCFWPLRRRFRRARQARVARP